MRYIDIAIPLIAGLVLVAISAKLSKERDGTYEKKKPSIKKCGYALIVVAVFYSFLKMFGQ